MFSNASMRLTAKMWIVAVIMTSVIYPGTILRGMLRDTTYELTGNPYIVDSTIIVPMGCKVSFKEGCIVLVNPYCGVDVSGNFLVRGTDDKPVIFTSVYDNRHNPNAEHFPQRGDWNGITFQLTSDTVLMEHFTLSYSVYGIKSWNSRIVIHNGLFGKNEQYNLVINDRLQLITEDVPFSYNSASSLRDSLDAQARKVLYEQRVKRKKMLSIATLAAGCAIGGIDAFFWNRYIYYRNKVPDYRGSQDELEELKNRRSAFKTASIAAAVATGAMLSASLTLRLIPVRASDQSTGKTTSSLELQFRGGGLMIGLSLKRRTSS